VELEELEYTTTQLLQEETEVLLNLFFILLVEAVEVFGQHNLTVSLELLAEVTLMPVLLELELLVKGSMEVSVIPQEEAEVELVPLQQTITALLVFHQTLLALLSPVAEAVEEDTVQIPETQELVALAEEELEVLQVNLELQEQ